MIESYSYYSSNGSLDWIGIKAEKSGDVVEEIYVEAPNSYRHPTGVYANDLPIKNWVII